MYPIPPSETLVKTKTCRHCSTSFPITDKDMEFYEKVSPVFSGKKYSIPTPTLCPDCRQQRRLSFRNERKLYKRKCDATGRDIISIYSPDKPFKVYHQDFWWSDKWDAMEYGRDFDFGRGFFEQFGELLREVPIVHSTSMWNENSNYAWSVNCKNCYFLFVGAACENCYYDEVAIESNNCIDCMDIKNCENCYMCLQTEKSYQCFFSESLNNCTNCFFSYGLENCENCIFSTNLKHKKYCIENKQCTKEAYEEYCQTLFWTHWFVKTSSDRLQEIKLQAIRKNLENTNSENCEWNMLTNCNNCVNIFYGTDSENCRNSDIAFNNKDSYDCGSYLSGLCLEVATWGQIFHSAFCNEMFQNGKYSLYSSFCDNSSHLFWCIGLRNKSYCILNKQYTKEQYEELVPKIIEHMQKTGEWGEFFPSSLSPFGYNETVAQEYYPLTREKIIPPTPLTKGGDERSESGGFIHWATFNWSDYEAPFPKVEKIIPASKLPDDISKIPDDILNWAIECEVTKRPFRIIKQELEFYRKHNLQIPRRHPDQRHLDRMALRNPRKLFERKCDKCRKDMITTYAPERPERVYCESCYNNEVM